jgi:chitosanase
MTDLQKRTTLAIVNVFETGSVRGDYGRVTVMPGDAGHLSYGRSQASLASGNLFALLNAYCAAPAARFAAAISPYLDRLRRMDASLDGDADLAALLARAARDPVMCQTQDDFFDRAHLAPACRAAAGAGLESPLGQTVVYDSFIQGGWATVQRMVESKMGPVSAATPEQGWVACYVDLRRQWLASLAPPACNTVYRMDSFRDLIRLDKWQLELPITVRGVVLDLASVDGSPAARTLQLERPNLSGDDVKALQAALASAGFPNVQDGIFGAETDRALRAFQRAKGLQADGVAGPRTRSALRI